MLIKIVIQKSQVLNLMHFQGKIVHFSLKNKALRSKSVKTPIAIFQVKNHCLMFDIKITEQTDKLKSFQYLHNLKKQNTC